MSVADDSPLESNAAEPRAFPEPVERSQGAKEAIPSQAMAPSRAFPENQPGNEPSPLWKDRVGLAMVTCCVVIAAAGWYLLKEFAPLLRPLVLAIFLCYVILPSHQRLTQRIPALASMVVLAGISVGLLVLLAWLVLGSAAELSEELPRLFQRAESIIRDVERHALEHLPTWLAGAASDLGQGQAQVGSRLGQVAGLLARAAADLLSEALLVGIYLLFLLVEAGHLPHRIQCAFRGEQPAQILAVVGNINEAMARYLRVKVKASLVLAIPATVLLWAFGVKFALMWGLLTFLLNFIPYLGSLVTCGTPILLAFLQMDSTERPVVVAVLLLSLHALSAYLIEPPLTGKAVGLSPVVILVALSFWGLCWGIIGMLLAVPLTVMMKIVLANLPFTQPFARLLADD